MPIGKIIFLLAGNFIFSTFWISLHIVIAKLLWLIDSLFASDFTVSTDLTNELDFYNPNWISAFLIVSVSILRGS